jgi:hypothetical protein
MEQRPSWQSNSFSASPEIPLCCGTRMFINAFTNARQLSVSSARVIQSVSPHPTACKLVLILSSNLHLRLPVLFLSNVLLLNLGPNLQAGKSPFFLLCETVIKHTCSHDPYLPFAYSELQFRMRVRNNSENQPLASSCLSARMKQLRFYWKDFN